MIMKKLFIKLKHIFLGNLYNLIGINYKLMNSRLEICSKCNEKANLTKNVEICSECGCILKAKARIEEESCYLGKW